MALVPDRPTPAKTGLHELLDWLRRGGIGRHSACRGLWVRLRGQPGTAPDIVGNQEIGRLYFLYSTRLVLNAIQLGGLRRRDAIELEITLKFA
jgi:hypothetical protein